MPRKQISEANKQETIRAIQCGQLTVREASEMLGVGLSTVGNWVWQARKSVAIPPKLVVTGKPAIQIPTTTNLNLEQFVYLLKDLVSEYVRMKENEHRMRKQIDELQKLAGSLNEQLLGSRLR